MIVGAAVLFDAEKLAVLRGLVGIVTSPETTELPVIGTLMEGATSARVLLRVDASFGASCNLLMPLACDPDRCRSTFRAGLGLVWRPSILSLSLCSSTRAAAPVSTFGEYSGERVDLVVFDPLDSLASGPARGALFSERRRFRLLCGMTKSTECERLGSFGGEAIETGVWGFEGRSVRAAVALDVAVDVAKSAI